jgi:hypothetical protein
MMGKNADSRLKVALPSEIKSKIHEARLEQQHFNQSVRGKLIEELNSMAVDKKGKGFVRPAPGKISAMFNRYNEANERSRLRSRAVRLKGEEEQVVGVVKEHDEFSKERKA